MDAVLFIAESVITMSLNYDQSSFVRLAFEEAYIPPSYRRRAERIKQRVDVKLSPWLDGRLAEPFAAMITDYSATGFGVMHDRVVQIGSQYVLELPRPDSNPLSLVLRAARCDAVEEQGFEIGLEYESVLDERGNIVWGPGLRRSPRAAGSHRHTSLVMVLLLVLFSLIGIVIGAMM